MKRLDKKQFEKAIKNTLFSISERKVKYENKKPSKDQLNQNWKLEKRCN